MTHEQQTIKLGIRSMPTDQRVTVIIHEIISETQSFITSTGLVSFIPDGPEELEKINEIDELVRRNYDRILESPPMMHVRAGHSVLAFYQDTFYRGFCLRASSKDAEIWFADYGNVAHVAKTDIRTIPKDLLVKPSVSMLGKLNVLQRKSPEGELQSWILEDFNQKVMIYDDRKADFFCCGVTRSPFKIYLVDVVFGDAYSSFLTLLSNRPKLDWGLSPLSQIDTKTPNSRRVSSASSPATSPFDATVGARDTRTRSRTSSQDTSPTRTSKPRQLSFNGDLVTSPSAVSNATSPPENGSTVALSPITATSVSNSAEAQSPTVPLSTVDEEVYIFLALHKSESTPISSATRPTSYCNLVPCFLF